MNKQTDMNNGHISLQEFLKVLYTYVMIDQERKFSSAIFSNRVETLYASILS